MDSIYTMHYALCSGVEKILYYALYSIFGEWILYTMHYAVFSGVDTIYTMHYEVFSGDGYYLYYVLRSIFGDGYYLYYTLYSIFGGRILFILNDTRYFRMPDTIYILHCAGFSGNGYY